MRPIMFRFHPLRPDPLHIQSMLTLWLALLDAALFEIHVRSVIHATRSARIGALLAAERGHHVGSDAGGGAVGVELLEEGAAEGGLGDAGFAEVGGDFAADFVAGVVDLVGGG
jgi:hypothetical protein